MSITSKSDADILAITLPMIDHVINASNQKNWDLFSTYQTEQEAGDPSNRAMVEKLWEEQPFFTSLNL